MKILLLSGPAGGGKTTLANHPRWRKHVSNEVDVHKFAGPLKSMCVAMGMTEDEVNGSLKEEPMEWLGGVTPRHVQQTLGTDWGRMMIHEDIWVKAALRNLAWSKKDGCQLAIFDDTRFPNEVSMLKDVYGDDVLSVHVEPSFEAYEKIQGSGHESEGQELPLDAQVLNNGGWDHMVDVIWERMND